MSNASARPELSTGAVLHADAPAHVPVSTFFCVLDYLFCCWYLSLLSGSPRLSLKCSESPLQKAKSVIILMKKNLTSSSFSFGNSLKRALTFEY